MLHEPSQEDRRKTKILFAAVLSAMVFFLSAGCGKKAFPTAPSSLVPEPPKKFEVVAEKGEVRVSWGLSGVENIKAIHLYRSKMPKERFCPTCPYTFEPVATLDPSEKYFREKSVPAYHYAFKIEIEGVGGQVSSPRIATLETP